MAKDMTEEPSVGDGKIRGPGDMSITFTGLTLWECRELLKTMDALDKIRPLPKRAKKAKRPRSRA